MFQSTRPCGARRFLQDGTAEMGSFNPRAHAGRDNRKIMMVTNIEVSIHAPMRGATAGVNRVEGLQDVSIHAPMRGAT